MNILDLSCALLCFLWLFLYSCIPSVAKELLLILIDNLNFRIWKRKIKKGFK
jgi:hypothetical protein